MAITLDQLLGSAAPSAANTSLAFTTTAAVAAGARIVIAALNSNGVTVASCAGGGLTWSLDGGGADAGVSGCVVYFISALAPAGLASGTTITATMSASSDAKIIGGASFLGIDTTTPIDTAFAVTGTNPAGASWATPSTAISAGALMLGATMAEFGASQTSTTSPGAEIFDRLDAFGDPGVMAYRIEPSAGSYTIGGSWSAGTLKSSNASIAYKADAGVTAVGRNRSRSLLMV